MALHTRILLGLVIGAAIGIGVNLGLGGDHAVVAFLNTYVAGPVGQVFLRMLFMIVMPLVFASISLGVAGIGDIRGVGRVGGKTLGFFLGTTVMAASLGLVIVSAVRPGELLDASTREGLLRTYANDASSTVATAASSGFGIDTLLDIVTRNPIRSAADGDILGVIFFGLMFGAALTLIDKDRAAPMVGFLEALNDIVVKIVEMAMKLAPYGVAGLIFGVTSRFGFALLQPLGVYVATVLGALLLHALVTMALIIRLFVGVSPRVFFSRIKASLVTAFSTSSSSATLPTNIAVAEDRLGIPPKVAGFVLPLGATMCMNGTSLFEGITVIFLCQVFGVDLSLGQMAVVMSMAVITAIGAAGVPGGSIPLLVGILAMFGVPGEGIAIILGVDRILDMSRATVNVLGDLVGTTVIARHEGVWKPSDLPSLQDIPLDESPDWPRGDDIQPRHVPTAPPESGRED
ncbi:MAG: dicarboxylate/amino acid:cation symporter [Myxococcales bacterium FL481]|nr:MAG: dicarboxylate/amino acid:cation symporter [Myxococcales bacterium FL481]